MVPVGWLVPGCWLVPIVGLLVKSCDKAGNTASANNGLRIEAWLPECHWYAMVWMGMVWYAMVWYSMVWYAMAPGVPEPISDPSAQLNDWVLGIKRVWGLSQPGKPNTIPWLTFSCHYIERAPLPLHREGVKPSEEER